MWAAEVCKKRRWLRHQDIREAASAPGLRGLGKGAIESTREGFRNVQQFLESLQNFMHFKETTLFSK